MLQRITTDGREVRGTARIGYTRSAWWLAVQVQAPAAERLQLIIGQTFLDDLEVWLFDGEQPLAPLYSGAKRSFSERGEPYPQFLLSLPRLDDGPYSLLLRVQSQSAINLPLQLVGAEHGQQLIAHSWLRSGLLIGAIDRWVIQHLCAWLAANPRHLVQLAQVNVNLSANSLLDGNFHRLLQDELQRHDLPPGKLCIEVTEMVALGELNVSAQWIEELRNQGLKVALDDFASGFASYAYLRHLPLDILKIDGSFISGIEHDPINQAMVGSMRQIAGQLGLLSVAEFVETQASLDCLRNLGIDYAQGYFVGRPQPLRQLADDACQYTQADR